MKRSFILTGLGLCLAMILGLGLFSTGPASAVSSLRGDNPLDAKAKMESKKRIVTKEGGFKRSWKLQPPVIPHKINKERITLEGNSCLRCHSLENYKKEKAPKIGDSHFIDASGKKLDKITMRRYFCVQCHAPQHNAKPLVENTFVGQ